MDVQESSDGSTCGRWATGTVPMGEVAVRAALDEGVGVQASETYGRDQML